jgi:NAD(P)-dependent dehydrogenase (short-subunit alcohol dehydrogenase family)
VPNALITGSNRGIGLEFARSLAADGWHVHACCRYPDKAKALKEVEGDIVHHRLDVTDGLRVASLARSLVDEPLDLLINNAGIYGPRDGFGKTDADAFEEVLRVNSLAPLRMAERFAEHLANSERKLLVNISSRLGSIACNESGGSYIYRASKAALNMVGKGLAADLAPRGITVVMFHPGWVKTDMGGQEADITPAESVAGMRAVLERVTPADSGRFFSYDGSEIPW